MNKKVMLRNVSEGISTALNIYYFINNLCTVADLYTVNPYRHPDYMSEYLEMIDTLVSNQEEPEEEVKEVQVQKEEQEKEPVEEVPESTVCEETVEEVHEEAATKEHEEEVKGQKEVQVQKGERKGCKTKKKNPFSKLNRKEATEDAVSVDEALKKADS